MCNNLFDVKYSDPRKLTLDEINVLDKMLSVDFLGKDILLKQLETVMVTGFCSCGCKTVNLIVDPNTPRYSFSERVPLKMLLSGSDGVPILVHLHIVEGYVSELEILRVDSQPISEELNLENAVITIHINQ